MSEIELPNVNFRLYCCYIVHFSPYCCLTLSISSVVLMLFMFKSGLIVQVLFNSCTRVTKLLWRYAGLTYYLYPTCNQFLILEMKIAR